MSLMNDDPILDDEPTDADLLAIENMLDEDLYPRNEDDSWLDDYDLGDDYDEYSDDDEDEPFLDDRD